LVAMATSLDKLKNKVQIDYLHLKLFHTVKRLRKSVQYIRRYLTKYASFLAVSYKMFTNELCQLWIDSLKFAVNTHIEVAISHFVSECHSNE